MENAGTELLFRGNPGDGQGEERRLFPPILLGFDSEALCCMVLAHIVILFPLRVVHVEALGLIGLVHGEALKLIL
jgi:hypothetical protein